MRLRSGIGIFSIAMLLLLSSCDQPETTPVIPPDIEPILEQQQAPNVDQAIIVQPEVGDRSTIDALLIEVPMEQIQPHVTDNKVFEIDIFEQKIGKALFRYDFDCDGSLDELTMNVYSGKNEDGMDVEDYRIVFEMNGLSVEQLSRDTIYRFGFTRVGIVDIDKNDNYIEFYVTDGYIYGETAIYRLTENGIRQIAHIEDIQGTSGDGKVYFWGGNLYEVDNKQDFNADLALAYYDLSKSEFVEFFDYTLTTEIVGKTFTSDREILVYKTFDDVIDGAPVNIVYDDIKDLTVALIKPGDRFTVIGLDEQTDQHPVNNRTKVRTADNKIGWIGGFHMVWD